MAGFTCSHCGRWYRYEKNLERHVGISHTSQPPSSCDQCFFWGGGGGGGGSLYIFLSQVQNIPERIIQISTTGAEITGQHTQTFNI